MIKHETSYGIIPLKFIQNHWEVLLIQHQSGHWSFPKGHPELNETFQQTASRELFEETGLQVEEYMAIESIQENYCFNWKGTLIYKKVIYYSARVTGKIMIQEKELRNYCWCSLEEAEKQATFEEAKKICRTIKDLLL